MIISYFKKLNNAKNLSLQNIDSNASAWLDITLIFQNYMSFLIHFIRGHFQRFKEKTNVALML